MLKLRWVFFAILLIATSNCALEEGHAKEDEVECRVYLAPTTIPNAGFGIFAGKNFQKDDLILYGDIAVPLDDMPFNTGSPYKGELDGIHFPWGDYTWDTSIADGIIFDYEGVLKVPDQILENVELASFGLGAMPNCKFGFVNLHSSHLVADSAGLDRNSPGNGAFTPYHSRKGYASQSILAGTELFEDYGEVYFETREDLAHVPRERDYHLADSIVGKMLKVRYMLGGNASNSLMIDLFDIVKNSWRNSRVLNALPDIREIRDDDANLELLLNIGLRKFEKKNTVRDIAWLKEQGQCMDGIRPGISIIPDAGRGAFATRDFQAGSKIAPVPLIHISDKAVMDMYAQAESEHEEYEYDEFYGEEFYYPLQRDMSAPIHKSLMLNYCFGHTNSTVLLSPYGSITSLINHGSDSAANAHMVWADNWMRHPEWLEMPPDDLAKNHYAGLGWDLVALRHIEANEEILIDYGSEWELAWEKYKEKWLSNKGRYTGTSFPYIPAAVLNENIEHVLIEAVETGTDYSYMGHGALLYCYISSGEEDRRHHFLHQCRPIAKHTSAIGEILFTVELTEWMEFDSDKEGRNSIWEIKVYDVLFGVPSSAFHFEELSYNAAHRELWSFRHEMMVPDDLFPQAWMNLADSKPQETNNNR